MKKFISVLLCLAILLSCSSCVSENALVEIKEERIVALCVDGTHRDASIEFCEEKGYKYIEFNSYDDCLLALENGKTEYVILNDVEYKKLDLSKDILRFVERINYSKEFCAVVSEDNPELLEEFNNAIIKLREDGTLNEVFNGYFENQRVDILPQNNKGSITILCSSVFDDYIFYDNKGTLTGLDVYFAEAILTYMGYTPVFIDCDFNEMFDSLKNGDGDVIFSAVEYNTQRAEEYLLTESYYSESYNLYERTPA